MRRLYSIILYLLLPYLLLRLYWKGRREPAYRQRIAERLSFVSDLPQSVDLWVHAVSLGEAIAVTPLVERFLESGLSVLFTTMTPTGSAYVQSRFHAKLSHCYLPFDLPWCIKRFVNRVQANLVIIMETELWPNLIHYTHQAGIPLVLVNARISDKALRGYQKIAWFLRPMLRSFKLIGTQSSLDADRYLTLGASEAQIKVLGNIKFDIPRFQGKDLLALKRQWGPERMVLIAASTHEDEEAQLLNELPRLKACLPNLLFLIAPRRPERFQSVFVLAQSLGYRVGLRSQPQTLDPELEVLVCDSIGELMSLYALCEFAFVGGSLVDIGGHNVLEPIALGLPVLCGPYMQNFASITQELLAHQALYQAQTVQDLVDKLIEWQKKPEQGQLQAKHASDVLQSNRGALDRYHAAIMTILDSNP